jgi:exodeoxyribonuclease VIII
MSSPAENLPEQDDQPRWSPEPGWYRDVSNTDYHRGSGTSSTTIKKYIDSNQEVIDYERQHPKPSSDAMEKGSALHVLVLEPEKASDEIAVMPSLNLRTNASKEAKAIFLLENEGKIILKPEDYDKAAAMADRVKSHPFASALLDGSINESSVYWWYNCMDPDDQEEYKIFLKVRPDALSPAHNAIIDLKSTADASYSGFAKTIVNFGYHLSAAMYAEGVNQCKPLLKETGCIAYNHFVFIAVESEPPYSVAVYELPATAMDHGRTLYRQALYRLHKFRQADWKGYPLEIREIELPPWAARGHVV